MEQQRQLLHPERDVPCGWNFFCGATSFSISANTFPELVEKVHEHLAANSINVSMEVAEQACHEQICSKLPENYWRYSNG